MFIFTLLICPQISWNRTLSSIPNTRIYILLISNHLAKSSSRLHSPTLSLTMWTNHATPLPIIFAFTSLSHPQPHCRHGPFQIPSVSEVLNTCIFLSVKNLVFFRSFHVFCSHYFCSFTSLKLLVFSLLLFLPISQSLTRIPPLFEIKPILHHM